MIENATRQELQQALDLANCKVDLDTALLSPALSRCLELSVVTLRKKQKAVEEQEIVATTEAMDAWAKRLRHLAGNLDWQSLKAGEGVIND